MKPRDPAPPQPTGSELAPAILWLRSHGTSSDKMADAFGLKGGHIRVLAHRARQAEEPSLPAATARTTVAEVRADEDAVLYNSARRRRVERLNERVESVWAHVQEDWNLASAIYELRRLRPLLGLPTSVPLKRLVSFVHQIHAWCRLHQGRPQLALVEAKKALTLHAVIHREATDMLDVVRIGETTLIASQAALLQRDASAADNCLILHQQAHERTGEPLNVEYYRQRGVLAFQRNDDVAAGVAFRESARVLRDTDASWLQAHAAERHLSLVGRPSPDRARHALNVIERRFPRTSLEAVVAGHWAVAAAIASGGRIEANWAADHLATIAPAAARFDHQQLVAFYLARTSRLKLSADVRLDWVKWLLYPSVSA